MRPDLMHILEEGRICKLKGITSRFLLAVSAMFAATSARAVSQAPVQVVPSVDLARYVGKWYEIAHLPAWFQRDCASDTTATYTCLLYTSPSPRDRQKSRM